MTAWRQHSVVSDAEDECEELWPLLHEKRVKTFLDVWKTVTTGQDRFPVLARLVHLVYTLPVNTAECEWGFSTQNRIKTPVRNRLSPESLDDLVLISRLGPLSRTLIHKQR